jgi:hypothetical protein
LSYDDHNIFVQLGFSSDVNFWQTVQWPNS